MAGPSLTSSALLRSLDGGLINANGTGNDEIVKAMNSIQISKDQYRGLYEEMKQQYAKLTEDSEEYKRKLEIAAEEHRLMQEKFRNIVDKLQMENRKKTTEIEEMKTKVCDKNGRHLLV